MVCSSRRRASPAPSRSTPCTCPPPRAQMSRSSMACPTARAARTLRLAGRTTPPRLSMSSAVVLRPLGFSCWAAVVSSAVDRVKKRRTASWGSMALISTASRAPVGGLLSVVASAQVVLGALMPLQLLMPVLLPVSAPVPVSALVLRLRNRNPHPYLHLHLRPE